MHTKQVRVASARTPLGEFTRSQALITGFDLRRSFRGDGKEKKRRGKERKEMKERNGKKHALQIPGFGLHCRC